MEAFEKACIRNRDFLPTHIFLAISYGETGHKKKAETEVAEILGINPDYSLKLFKGTFPLRDQAAIERSLNALRKAAGLK